MTIQYGVARLKPGDTLYLRGGTYYECVTMAVAGTPEKPITVRSYPGELAILDGGLREFFEDPAKAWEPVPGSDGEFRSTKSYTHGGGFGNFGDSMVPLHRYLNLTDLRSRNEYWITGLNDRQPNPKGLYCGPGVYRNPETGRIHIRLFAAPELHDIIYVVAAHELLHVVYGCESSANGWTRIRHRARISPAKKAA